MPSIGVVGYTVADVYNGEQGNSITSLPAVWKRMLITCLWYFLMNFVIILGCSFVLLLSVMIQYWLLLLVGMVIGLVVFVYLGMYVAIVWQVANVVSVMEEEYYGWEGMKNSRHLIHGKRTTAWALFVALIVIVGLFNFVAVIGCFCLVGFGAKLLYAIAYVVLACVINLMWEVTQSVLYFVCKSHHGHSVDEWCSLESCHEKTNNNNC
ncbi:hypothetical protein SUGI_1197190 [Cryptomeria japonica]|nr:hypothetical protein SUGI_1197190 [Cryptomeria japonica]